MSCHHLESVASWKHGSLECYLFVGCFFSDIPGHKVVKNARFLNHQHYVITALNNTDSPQFQNSIPEMVAKTLKLKNGGEISWGSISSTSWFAFSLVTSRNFKLGSAPVMLKQALGASTQHRTAGYIAFLRKLQRCEEIDCQAAFVPDIWPSLTLKSEVVYF